MKKENAPLQKKERNFKRWCYLAFGVVLALLALWALNRRGVLAPLSPAHTSAAAPEAPTPSPEPEPQPAPALSVPSALPVAIRLGGAELAVTESRETAEALLKGLLARHAAEAEADSGGRAVEAWFAEAPAIAPRAGGQPMGEEEALARLEAALTVCVAVETQSIEKIPVETQTSRDRDLMEGTRIIVSLGRAGSRRIIYRTVYENGVPGEAVESGAEVLRESEPLVIVNGSMDLPKQSATPSRSEGKRGPRAEGLAFAQPVKQRVEENFGGLKGGYHYGLDYDTKPGETVYASAPGIVAAAFERGGYGIFVEIDHGGGFLTRYAQLGDALVEPGDMVNAGEPVGIAGEQPLHFELRVDGRAYNPRYYLD